MGASKENNGTQSEKMYIMQRVPGKDTYQTTSLNKVFAEPSVESQVPKASPYE